MSAIYGCVNLNSQSISKVIASKMFHYYETFEHNRHTRLESEYMYVAKLQQHITHSDKASHIDVYEDSNYLITADVILDNRDQLNELLNIGQMDALSDTEIIVQLYYKFGQSMIEHIIGDFAIIIYDKLSKQLVFIRDHVGSRTLYYYRDEETIYFSTLLKPLEYCLKGDVIFNEKWFVDFNAIVTVQQELTENETMYQNVYHVNPACILTVDREGSESRKYWFPERVKKTHYADYDEAINSFRKLFEKVVESKLRTFGPIASQISGGLDSSSVICMASNILRKGTSSIHAFNFIPEAKYKLTEDNYSVFDESPYVKKIVEKCENVAINFESFEGVNTLNTMNDLILCLGGPFKYIENGFWINQISLRAKEMGCKIILNGQFGNTTISNGGLFDYMVSLFRQGRIKRVLLTANQFCTTFNVSRKRFIEHYFRLLIRNLKTRFNTKFWNDQVSNDYIRKYRVVQRLCKKGLNYNRFYTLEMILLKSLDSTILNHIAPMSVCLGLRDALLYRDPTKDKRIIEFMLSLPTHFYIKDGVERSFIKNAMRGYVPDLILDNHFKKGVQYGDWELRINDQIDNIDHELMVLLKDPNKLPWLNREKLMDEHFSSIRDTLSLQSKLRILVLSRFFDINIERKGDIKDEKMGNA